MSHVPPWWESILVVKVEAVQRKQVPLEWTKTSGRLLEWWHDAGVSLAFVVQSASSEVRREPREFFPDQAAKGALISSYEAETGLLWKCAGPSCFLSRGDWYAGELLELQQGCEGPFGLSRG